MATALIELTKGYSATLGPYGGRVADDCDHVLTLPLKRAATPRSPGPYELVRATGQRAHG
jgi:hypothetical protein